MASLDLVCIQTQELKVWVRSHRSSYITLLKNSKTSQDRDGVPANLHARGGGGGGNANQRKCTEPTVNPVLETAISGRAIYQICSGVRGFSAKFKTPMTRSLA